MKKINRGVTLLLCGLALSCASQGSAPNSGSAPNDGLMSLDDAISGAAAAVREKVEAQARIVISPIKAPERSDFLTKKLEAFFTSNYTELEILTRDEEDLKRLREEQTFQASGLVKDADIVGLGEGKGAQIVISGKFEQLDSFSQLTIRAIEVATTKVLIVYSVLIDNNDPILAGIVKPLENGKAPAITENVLNALKHLNQGEDYFAKGERDKAKEELDKALALNKDLVKSNLYEEFGLAADEQENEGIGLAADEQENEGIGLTAGVELGLGDVTESAVFSMMPNLVYERSFGALDVFGELDYTIAFDDPVNHAIYLEAELGYNLAIREPSTLSFIINNKNIFSWEDEAAYHGVFEPSIKYTHNLSFGDLYGQLGVPYGHLNGVVPIWSITGTIDEAALGLYATLGWASTFGLGLELTAYTALHPEADFSGYGLLASYEKGICYGEIEFIAGKEFKELGIYPEIDVSLGAWTFTARMELEYTGDDWAVRPFIGASYGF